MPMLAWLVGRSVVGTQKGRTQENGEGGHGMKRVVVGVQFNMLAFVAAFCLALSLICCFRIADESATRPAATLDRYNSRESRLTTTMCCVSFGQIPKRFETTRDNLKRIKEQFSRPKSFNLTVYPFVCFFPRQFFGSGLNFQDLMVRLGAIDSPPKTPCILGLECAGEVEAVGEGVEDFKVSEESHRKWEKENKRNGN